LKCLCKGRVPRAFSITPGRREPKKDQCREELLTIEKRKRTVTSFRKRALRFSKEEVVKRVYRYLFFSACVSFFPVPESPHFLLSDRNTPSFLSLYSKHRQNDYFLFSPACAHLLWANVYLKKRVTTCSTSTVLWHSTPFCNLNIPCPFSIFLKISSVNTSLIKYLD
jgi:hypothetical protein